MTEGQVIGLPVVEQERYVTRAELAEIMGVSVRSVDEFRRQGMPYENWGMRVIRFRPSLAIAWVRTQARDRNAA